MILNAAARMSVLMSMPSACVASASAGPAQQPDGMSALRNDAAREQTVVPVQYGGGRIDVLSATYGGNCEVPRGNVTGYVAQARNGRRFCEFVVSHRYLGDPAPACPKGFFVRWQCGGNVLRAGAPPEASGRAVRLGCRF